MSVRFLQRAGPPAEEPDLLDRLVRQDREERAAAGPQGLGTLLHLLRVQEGRGRPITGGGGVAWPRRQEEVEVLLPQVLPMADYSPPGFPPASLKLPPPFHPPAVSSYSPNTSPNLSYSPLPSSLSYSPLPTATPPPPGSPASLHLRLEEAQLQLRAMERERKRAEAALARHHPGLARLGGSSGLATVGGGAPRLPFRPSRLDRLVVDSWREHARVTALLERMARVRGGALHPGIRATVAGWQEAVTRLQGLRAGQVAEVVADGCIADYSKAVRRARWGRDIFCISYPQNNQNVPVVSVLPRDLENDVSDGVPVQDLPVGGAAGRHHPPRLGAWETGPAHREVTSQVKSGKLQ